MISSSNWYDQLNAHHAADAAHASAAAPVHASASQRISDQVAGQLYTLVQQRQLQPGQRLPAERQLAALLGVSRTALREAIQKLSSQGILRSRPGAGTFVQEAGSTPADWQAQAVAALAPLLRHDPQYRYDVLETRQILEAGTAWHAAQRATAQDKAQIQRCFDNLLHCQRIEDSQAAARADAQFHLAIAEASHNAVIVQVMRSLFELMHSTMAENRQLLFVHTHSAGLAQLTQQHHDLMQAIVAGEPERARSVIGEHLHFVHDQLVQADADAARQQRLGRLSSSISPSP